MKWAAILRLSHQKVATQTNRKNGVMTMEERTIVVQARIEYTFWKNALIRMAIGPEINHIGTTCPNITDYSCCELLYLDSI